MNRKQHILFHLMHACIALASNIGKALLGGNVPGFERIKEDVSRIVTIYEMAGDAYNSLPNILGDEFKASVIEVVAITEGHCPGVLLLGKEGTRMFFRGAEGVWYHSPKEAGEVYAIKLGDEIIWEAPQPKTQNQGCPECGQVAFHSIRCARNQQTEYRYCPECQRTCKCLGGRWSGHAPSCKNEGKNFAEEAA